MARIVKEHTVRRNEILDAAQRLVYTRGYEQMTIQDILDDLQISKGAFYHYFTSKQTLLEAVIERMLDDLDQRLVVVVQDAHLPALEKLQRFFEVSNRWKIAQKDFLLALLRVMYSDDNALFRQKLSLAGIERLMLHLQAIIRQGIQEGVLTTPYPDQIGGVIVPLIQHLGETVARHVLAHEADDVVWSRIKISVAVYTNALERVLGIPDGTMQLVDPQLLNEWFLAIRGNAASC